MQGFQIRVVSRIPAARFLASTPEGGLLVSQPSRGKIWWIYSKSGDASPPVLAAAGLRLPHRFSDLNVGFASDRSKNHPVSRFRYDPNVHKLLIKEVVVANLPDASSPELGRAYGHQLKNLTIGPDRHLYVDIASSSNADPKDTTSDPIRCAIWRVETGLFLRKASVTRKARFCSGHKRVVGSGQRKRQYSLSIPPKLEGKRLG